MSEKLYNLFTTKNEIKSETECFKDFKLYERERTPKEIVKEEEAIVKIHKWLSIPLKPKANEKQPLSRQVMNKIPLPNLSGLQYQSMLGSGKHGCVALYQDRKSLRNLAVKFMQKTPSKANHSPRAEYEMGQYFQHLGLAAAFYWFWESDQAAALCQDAAEASVNEYLLCAFSQHHGDARFQLLAWLVQHILALFDALHHHHVAHGDLHPENIRIRWGSTKTRRLTLIDFGKSTNLFSDINYDMAQFLSKAQLYVDSKVAFRFPAVVEPMRAFLVDLANILQHHKQRYTDVADLDLKTINAQQLKELYKNYTKRCFEGQLG